MMSIEDAAPFAEREYRFLEIFEPDGWTIKTYAILAPGRTPSGLVTAAAKALTAEYLENPPFDDHYSVGFLGMHLGRDADFIFCNIWAAENELHHKFWVSEDAGSDRLAAPELRHPTVCCYDLHLQWHERQAWVRHILSDPKNADFDAYLADTQVLAG